LVIALSGPQTAASGAALGSAFGVDEQEVMASAMAQATATAAAFLTRIPVSFLVFLVLPTLAVERRKSGFRVEVIGEVSCRRRVEDLQRLG
jgi:hypothetical protein